MAEVMAGVDEGGLTSFGRATEEYVSTDPALVPYCAAKKQGQGDGAKMPYFWGASG